MWETLLLEADGNLHRDPQLDSVQRVRDFGALSPKWDVFIKDVCGREVGRL